jgi:hypothetical protein
VRSNVTEIACTFGQLYIWTGEFINGYLLVKGRPLSLATLATKLESN